MMKTLDALFEALDKLPKEERVKFVPFLKEFSKLFSLHNEGIQRINTFTAQFTTVVGVVFGVLAAFNSMGQNFWADIFYLVGILCCGICLVLCVICLCKPIVDNHNQQVGTAYGVFDEFIQAINVSVSEEDKPKMEKKRMPFQNMRTASYILFGISIVCVLAKIGILFYSSYFAD